MEQWFLNETTIVIITHPLIRHVCVYVCVSVCVYMFTCVRLYVFVCVACVFLCSSECMYGGIVRTKKSSHILTFFVKKKYQLFALYLIRY